ncbi:MAG: COR domain-containing protein [Ruminococcus sp.]|nr:COR domain-containing protein [Ruminococcus sp.]
MDKQNKRVFDLLTKIDNGYQPTKEETQFLEEQTELDLKDSNITILPGSIGKLKNLEKLEISFNQIETLPEAICNLTNLSVLYISNNQIETLPEAIGNLKNLSVLDISSNQIETLPEAICNLTNLSGLYISSNQIETLPEAIGNLTNLSVLFISGNQIETLPEAIGNLTNLDVLFISSNQIETLPEAIGNLTNLSGLFISSNQIKSLPEAIGNLKNLRRLDISNTKITALPDRLGELPNLQKLDLSGLTLPGIPEALAKKGLPFLETDSFYRENTGINLYNTTLTEQDKSIFLESPELIPSLYNQEEEIQLKECRVLFLGDGGSGKTYTIRRIQKQCQKETEEDPYITNETPGVEIADYRTKYDGENVCIHFWDFGGQAILHTMHRCFLSDKTCYVVTVRTRDTDNTPRARYWLRNVTAFAPNSPILLYVNCWEHSDGKRSIDETRLRRDFPNIKEVVYVSAKEAEADYFQTNLLNTILQMATETEIFRQRFNRRWIAVRDSILKKGETEPYISKDEYYKLCGDNDIPKEQAPGLLTYFNILGVCFSYHQSIMRQEFADYKLLTPVWLTNAIYSVIEEGVAQAQEGRIKISSIEQMLANKAPDQVIFVDENGEEKLRPYKRTKPELTYKDFECQYIIDVAQAHRLCYRIDNDTLFFPALCTNNTPEEALYSPEEYPQHIEYLLHYEYLPDSVVHQLMVQCLRADIALNHCWLNGMVLGSMDAHKAVVRMDDDENLWIEIWSKPEHPSYDFFKLLRREIIEINERLNLKTKEFIVDGEDRYYLVSLLNAVKGTGVVYGNDSGNERRAADLLGLFYENWTLKFTQVQNGVITIPILPKKFHDQSRDDQAFRRALYEAYNHICPYCNGIIDSIRDMQIDHILPQKYKELPELKEYISYLQECGFDVSKPDYVENYMPSHGRCNLDKSNNVELFSILARHEIAWRKTDRVLKLYEKYKKQS